MINCKKSSGFLVVILLIASLTMSSCGKKHGSQGNNTNRTDSVVMFIPEPAFNFGDVKEGEKISHDYLIQNKGDYDLIIFEVNRTCGCTVVDYEKGPIAPGKSGKVKISFNTTGRAGKVYKKLVVISNSQHGNPDLILQGNVIASDSI